MFIYMKNAFFLISLFIGSNAFAAVEVTTDEEENVVRIYLNNTFHAPVTAALKIKLENARLKSNKLTIVCPPNERVLINTVERVDTDRKWRFKYSYRYLLGSYLARHDYNHAYNIPFALGKKYMVGQGFGGKSQHTGNSYYAIDFTVPEGTKVYPAREGTVIEVINKFSKGGLDKSLKGNAVYILHSDGTIGFYLHLAYKKVFVSVGDAVDRNTVIALSGNTGYSSGPHLHFEVIRPESINNYISNSFHFASKSNPKFMPVLGKTYTVDR